MQGEHLGYYLWFVRAVTKIRQRQEIKVVVGTCFDQPMTVSAVNLEIKSQISKTLSAIDASNYMCQLTHQFDCVLVIGWVDFPNLEFPKLLRVELLGLDRYLIIRVEFVVHFHQ